MRDLPGILLGRDTEGFPTATIYGRTVRLYAHLVIVGPPISWKRENVIVQRGPRASIGKTTKAKKWIYDAELQLRAQWRGRDAIELRKDEEFNAAVITYQAKGQCIDADNLLGGPLDAMERAGVIVNDYWISTFDGSRRLRDAARPRVEVLLTGRLW